MIPDYYRPIFAADADGYIKRLAGWPYAGMAIAADRWAERKYHFAREIWPKREQACPGFKDENGYPITWAQRFFEMWHEPLIEYRKRLRAVRDSEANAA